MGIKAVTTVSLLQDNVEPSGVCSSVVVDSFSSSFLHSTV